LPVEWYEMTLAPGGQQVSDAHATGTFEHFSCLTGSVEIYWKSCNLLNNRGQRDVHVVDSIRRRHPAVHPRPGPVQE
jgi:hypothetical protein